MSIETIINYLRISDRLSSSGQPNENEFQNIAASGFGVVINLATSGSENAILEEGDIVRDLGMVYHQIPVPFDVPDKNHLLEFIDLMESHYEQNLWVHCVKNYRVSAFLYLYRLYKGMSEADACLAIFTGWEPDATWRAFMAQSTGD